MLFKFKQREKKISHESAVEQINRFFDHNDIEEEDIILAEKNSQINDILNKLVRHVQNGRIEFREEARADGKGNELRIIQHLKSGDTISYAAEARGYNKTQMKDRKEGSPFEKMYDLMGSMASMPSSAIANLGAADISVVECLGALFLIV